MELLSDPTKTNLYYGVDHLAIDIVRDMQDSSKAAGLMLTMP